MTEITLTFDNGPSVATTPGVLDELQARDLSAYFCLIGAQLLKGAEQVDIAKETLTRGHTLVNHSYTHDVALGDDPTVAHARREIADTHALMNDKLGNWGRHWFRPFGRGGEWGEHLLSQPAVKELQAHSYSVLIWNCVPRDWEDPTGWVETALTEIEAQDHTVLVGPRPQYGCNGSPRTLFGCSLRARGYDYSRTTGFVCPDAFRSSRLGALKIRRHRRCKRANLSERRLSPEFLWLVQILRR